MYNMHQIPRIIHQIWSGVDGPLPRPFKILGKTWKEHYPDWQYELWDNKRINDFIQEYYPHCWDVYNKYPYNIQRWDAIRYLILYKIGGMYVDFDYESVRPMDKIIEGHSCCFAEDKLKQIEGRASFNNALMLSVPGHSFMKKIIDTAFSEKVLEGKYISKKECVFNTTGPRLLIDLYEALTADEKEAIFIIPAKYVTPFNGYEARYFRAGERTQELDNALEEAYAVHYFCSNWAATDT